MSQTRFLAAVLCSAAFALGQAESRPAVNTLTKAERAKGWHLLFDGKTANGWRGYKKKAFPEKGWVVQDGALHHTERGGGGDIITDRRYRNFDLRLQWKVSPGANSGIMYRVAEDKGPSYKTGPEFQILDDAAHAKLGAKHKAGALYGLYAANGAKLAKTGEWNTARVRIVGNSITHWCNGVQVVDCNYGSDDWKARVAKSKFKNWKGFGKHARGHICLQDHGNAIAFRDIKIRELDPDESRYGEPVMLFDGKNMDAWEAHLRKGGQLADVWSVDDGIIVCKGRPIGYIYTKQAFESYVLDLEWRFNPVTKKAGNSGVLLRQTGPHKVWPNSIEAQLMSRNAGDFWNIGKYQMKTVASRLRGRNTKKTHGNEKPIGEWNRYRIIVDGPWVSLRVNGEVLNEAWGCEVKPGKICLQSEGAEIHFRKIRVTPLK